MSALVKSLRKAAMEHQAALHEYPPAPLNQLRSLASDLFIAVLDLKPPGEDELAKCWSKLAEWLDDSSASVRKLPLEVWRRVPEMLWMPHRGQPAIASSRLRQGLVWAASLSVPRVLWTLRLARAYILSAGAPADSRKWLGEIIREWCRVEDHARLTPWRHRDDRFQLWSPPDFPIIFTKALLNDHGISIQGLFENAGMASASALSGDLSREAFIQWLELRRAAAQGYDAGHISRVREWAGLLVGETAAWPRVLAASVINGLLEPWSAFNPTEPSFQREILALLKKWFGPDFIKREGVSESSRDILMRWQVLDVIEAYFDQVGKYAERLQRSTGQSLMHNHWKYRRPFWLAFYRTGRVSHARALIGDGMMTALGEKALREKFGAAMAKLASNDKNHCGLLLEINGMTIIDLSHNGRAYFFLQSNHLSPRRNKANFERSALNAAADETMVHSSPDTYTWQRNFTEYIRRHTGVSVPASSYHVAP